MDTPPAEPWPIRPLLQNARPTRSAPGARWRLALPPAPLLSIYVPTYHRPALLGQALRSLGRLPAGVEVVVSDNSTANDLGGRVAAGVLAGQPARQWRYLRNSPGQNVADNFAGCARRTRGQYLYQLHDDDLMRPGGLPALLAELRAAQGRREVLVFGVDLVDSRRRLIRPQRPARREWLAPPEALRRVLTNSSWIRIVALVASRQAYLAFPPDVSRVHTIDTDTWARFLGRYGVQLVPTCVAAWTVHPGSLTASMFTPATIRRLLPTFERARQQGLLPPAVLRRAQARFFHQFALAGTWRSIRVGDPAGARRALALLRLPGLRQLPVPLKWLPLRVGFTVLLWLWR